MTDCRAEFPKAWFARATLCAERHDARLNYDGGAEGPYHTGAEMKIAADYAFALFRRVSDATTRTSSSGSTGLGKSQLKPASSARRRSCRRECAVTAIATGAAPCSTS